MVPIAKRRHGPCASRALGAAIALLGLLACDGLFETTYGHTCPPGDYPRCSAANEVLSCLEDDYLHERPCEAGEVCLDGADSTGERWAECRPAGSEHCDADGDSAVCVEGGIVDCSRPGFPMLTPCTDGRICVEGAQGPVCAQQGSASCDPATFEETCDDGRPAWCDQEDGVVVFAEACAAPEVCRLGELGAVCATPDAEPCDYGTYESSCVGDSVLQCDGRTHFTELVDCPAGERCREGTFDPQCFGPDQPDCDPDTFVERCDGDLRVYCDSGYMVEESWSCTLGDYVCRTNESGAHCVDPDAVPCDDSTFAQRCDEGDLIVCTISDFTHRIYCVDGNVCVSTPVSAACAPPGTETCDPATFESSCDGLDYTTCTSYGFVDTGSCVEPRTCRVGHEGAVCTSATGLPCATPWTYLRCEDGATVLCDWDGFERPEACGDEQICVEGDYRYLGFTVHAYCVDAQAPSCDGSTPVACGGSVATVCFGGYEMQEDCGTGSICITDGAAWTCALDDAASCDPATYQATCVLQEMLYVCFGDPPVEAEVWCTAGCEEVDGTLRCAEP